MEKNIRRGWDPELKMMVECEPLFNSPFEFLNQFIRVNPGFNMVESYSPMYPLCRTFTWFDDEIPGVYVVVNATKKITTARLFRNHNLREEHVWHA